MCVSSAGVDAPKVFESRGPPPKHDHILPVPSASSSKNRSNAADALASVDGEEGREAEGGDNNLEEVRRMSAQRKEDRRAKKSRTKKIVGKASRNPMDYLIHINLTTFEKWVVAMLFVGMLGTALYQVCTGRFKFQLLKSVNIMRGGGRVE